MDSLDAGVAAVFRTVITGDQDQIQKAINNYREPGMSKWHRYNLYQEKDRDGRNLLHYVCMYNKDKVATWMLSLRDEDNDPIPKDSDKFGATAVMYAARAGMVTFVTEWIKRKCNINTVDKNGRNILHYCCGEGEFTPHISDAKQKSIDNTSLQQVAHILISNGIKHVIDPNFDTCLALNEVDVEKAMNMWKVERKAVRMLSPKQIYSPVIAPWEVMGGLMHVCVAECFTQNITLSSKQRIAMFEERIKTCKPDINDINEVDDNGMTALHYLCYYEFDSEPFGLRECLVDKLLQLGLDPKIKDIRGCTALMCGLEKGYIKKYESSDPRYANDKRIGMLLNVETSVTETDVKVNVKQIDNMMEEMKRREDLYRQELDKINEQFNQKLKDTTEQQNDTRKELTDQLNDTRKELTEQLNDTRKELIEMKTSKDELQERLEKQIKDLQLKVKDLEMRNETEQVNIDVPPSSLLLGNLVLSDVAHYLEADVEVTCLPDASLEDLKAAIGEDEQKYQNIYLITENKCTISDLNNLILQYKKLIDASKDKATKLIVASVLPTLDDGDVNDNIEQLNKELEALCQQTGCDFVNNNYIFRLMNGTIVEECFDEDGEILSGFGVKQLLRNLGLLITKKKQQATNI